MSKSDPRRFKLPMTNNELAKYVFALEDRIVKLEKQAAIAKMFRVSDRRVKRLRERVQELENAIKRFS